LPCTGLKREDTFPNCLIYSNRSVADVNSFDNRGGSLYTTAVMKKDIHPKTYRPVVFQDLNNNTTFLTRSTAETDETINLDGVEYPLVKVHISSASHPFFTGEERIVDVEGRVDKFKARAAAGAAARDKRSQAAKKETERKAAKAEKQAIKEKETAKASE
jgi:large subunit ribosomal protein L31